MPKSGLGPWTPCLVETPMGSTSSLLTWAAPAAKDWILSVYHSFLYPWSGAYEIFRTRWLCIPAALLLRVRYDQFASWPCYYTIHASYYKLRLDWVVPGKPECLPVPLPGLSKVLCWFYVFVWNSSFVGLLLCLLGRGYLCTTTNNCFLWTTLEQPRGSREKIYYPGSVNFFWPPSLTTHLLPYMVILYVDFPFWDITRPRTSFHWQLGSLVHRYAQSRFKQSEWKQLNIQFTTFSVRNFHGLTSFGWSGPN